MPIGSIVIVHRCDASKLGRSLRNRAALAMRYWKTLEYPASAKELNETSDEGGSDAESLDILRRFSVRGLKLRSGS